TAREQPDPFTAACDPVVADDKAVSVLHGDPYPAAELNCVVLDHVVPRIAHPEAIVGPAAIIVAKDVVPRKRRFNGVVGAQAAVVALDQVVVAGPRAALVIVARDEDAIPAAQTAIPQ